jgi:hypothetical protein
MSRVLNYVPRVAIFLAGIAAAAITLPRRERGGMDSAASGELKRALAGLRQIVAAMEQLLTKTMASLDDRLVTQADSIEVLKTTVSQTDSLLERVLESLDSLQTLTDPADCGGDPVLSRPRI